MQKSYLFPLRLVAAAMLAGALLSVPAHATSKEIIELQTQVQQLMDMVRHIQDTMDDHFGALTHLADQTADNANRVTAVVNAMQQKLNAQGDASNGKIDGVSGQIQSLNDSVDELKSRIAKLDKSISDMQALLQAMQTPAPGTTLPGGTTPGSTPTGPGGSYVPGTLPPPPVQPAQQAPPLAETFQAGVRDLNAARYQVAAGEFEDVIHYYPLDDLAGTSQFYLGEIAYRQLNYSDAIKNFNAVLESFPGNAKAPAAQLRKGMALLQINKKDAGIHELRLLIQRHPQTPEAAQARTKLNGMGVHIASAR
jgi:tol-pal system protein YbgF